MDSTTAQVENSRPSALKPPSRLPAMSNSNARPLIETSQSDLNSRTIPLPGTQTGAAKHKLSGLPEPPTKRKTLAERAAEPLNPLRSHVPAISRQPAPFARSEGSTLAQVSARPATSHAAYRSTSNTSTASSNSNGIRPPSRQNGIRGKPSNAAESRTEEMEMGVIGKRKAWDTKGRLEDMESMYRQLQSQIESAAGTKNDLEESLGLYKSRVQEIAQQKSELAQQMAQQKQEYHQQIKELTSDRRDLIKDLERARDDLHATTTDLQQARRDHEKDVQDLERKHERELNDLYNQQEREAQRLERELDKIAQQGEKEMEEAKRSWEKQKDNETAELTTQHWDEIEELKSKHDKEVRQLEAKIAELEGKCESRASESASEVQLLRDTIANLHTQLDTSNDRASAAEARIGAVEQEKAARVAAVEEEKTALISKCHFLEGNSQTQSLEYNTMRQQMQAALDREKAADERTKAAMQETEDTKDQLRKEEMVRRKLNATILELRGNIRVFVRTRPLLDGETDSAKAEYPDADDLDGGKELVVHAPTTFTATGKEKNDKHSYSFDRVFRPQTANVQVFEDCRELIQSVVDGYNVSILSYGQTGSGKTFGMSGPSGIIPCSIGLLLTEMQRLKEKGWEYHVASSFVEVYNETLNDLLGDAKTWDDGDDPGAGVRHGKRKEKHEIHHDSVTGKTTVSNLSSVTLWPPPEDEGIWPPAVPTSQEDDLSSQYTERAVTKLLDTAAKNRRVAATKANERSSRSHSVFILTLRGHCAITGESSEGVLNLVDLAGSERLKQSGAEGDRKKETQAINKSLSALGDVIGALGGKGGDGGGHVPYRNSKLTYLLQSSLGGTTASGKSSRTLMLLHLSPLAVHWQENKSSLAFGSKVHGTHIGAAKKR